MESRFVLEAPGRFLSIFGVTATGLALKLWDFVEGRFGQLCRNHIHVSKNRLAKSGFPDRKPSLIETSLSVLCVGRLRSICWKSLLNSKLLLELHRRQVISCALIGSMCAAAAASDARRISDWSPVSCCNFLFWGRSLADMAFFCSRATYFKKGLWLSIEVADCLYIRKQYI